MRAAEYVRPLAEYGADAPVRRAIQEIGDCRTATRRALRSLLPDLSRLFGVPEAG